MWAPKVQSCKSISDKLDERSQPHVRICPVQRQKEVVKNLYAECMALEELLEESVNTLGPDARDILTQVR